MTYRSRQSKQKQSQIAYDMADDIDAHVLHNLIHDQINQDEELAQLCDAAAAADLATEIRNENTDRLVRPLREAWSNLDQVARQRGLEIVGECCATVIQRADDWIGEPYDEQAVREAQEEARQYLRKNTTVAKAAGVEEVA